MPLHDWTKVPTGLFHDFHQSWSIRIKDALNSGLLPKGVAALVEQRSGPWEPDVLAIESRSRRKPEESNGGVATMKPPVTRIVRRTSAVVYADRANRILVKHHLGKIIAVIEIVSPGNKDSRRAFEEFVKKTTDLMYEGIHVLVIDLFPPTPRDPVGIHKPIWDFFLEENFAFPPGKDRIIASYDAGRERIAYVEPIAVGDTLPDMPLILSRSVHVLVPLESTYMTTWNASPEEMREAVITGVMPEPEE